MSSNPNLSVPRPRVPAGALALVALIALGIIGFAAWSFATRKGPADFFLDPPTVESRREVVEKLMPQQSDPQAAAQDREVARMVAQIQLFALSHGHFPRTVRDLESGLELEERGYRVVEGRDQWRIYGPENRVLARGN